MWFYIVNRFQVLLILKNVEFWRPKSEVWKYKIFSALVVATDKKQYSYAIVTTTNIIERNT